MNQTTFYRLSISTILILVFGITNLFGQSFERGNKILNTGIKISIYKILNENEKDENEDDDGGGAASYTIPVGFEYALSNRIGLGAELGFCNYFTGEDSVTRAIAEASSFDLLIKGNFHWIKGGKANLSSGLGIGFSNFTYSSNDNLDSQFKSTGFYFRLSMIDFKLYFGKRVGWNVFMGVPVMNFENGRITDNLGSDFSYPLSFTGFDLGTGIVVKW
jgi:hypothetical protein